MPATYQTERRVEFRDTDAAGIMHFSTYFTYMEQVEHEFLRSLGTSVVSRGPDGVVSWPRVSAHCNYASPARFEDILEIELFVERIGSKSVTYGFNFHRDGSKLAQGAITVVCCQVEHGQRPISIEIPTTLADQLAAYLITT